MPLTFDEAKGKYQADAITELSLTEEGRRFLLLLSLSPLQPRQSGTDHLQALAKECKVDVSNIGTRDLFPTLFNSTISIDQIKASVKAIFKSERTIRAAHEPTLINELYKMKEFYWGGLHQNALERTIVDNYVKKIPNYEDLNARIENELFHSMKGYVRCSWYNHWTSIIIEDIFKEHKSVLPTVSKVKKIDFFVHEVPFDLKVTYLPEGYVKAYRTAQKAGVELTLLKRAAQKRSLVIDPHLNDADLLEHLWSVITDQPDEAAKRLIGDLRDMRMKMVDEIAKDPSALIKWLYENQGERRFDASNRLFLVLVNQDNFFQSWQLKRNRTLLAKEIGQYLDTVPSSVGKAVTFDWKGKTYKTTADVVLVCHNPA